MFNEIKVILEDIYKYCKKLYVSSNLYIKIENQDQIKCLEFVIVKRGVIQDNIIYFEKINEKSTDKKLLNVKKKLLEIKKEWECIYE